MSSLIHRILDFNEGRLPEMLDLKYRFMAENMFRFYRGTCHIFYEDLAGIKDFPDSPASWISGDLHLENFGSFRGDNRLVYFDLNDFDEALLAPAAWEVVRVVTSIFIAFETMKIEEKKAWNMAQLFLRTYSQLLEKGKANYIEPQTARGIVQNFLTAVSRHKQKRILKKRTIKKKDRLVMMMDDPRHFEIDKFLKRELCYHITDWIMYSSDGPFNYEVIDAVFRLAGTGSVGLKRYAFLLRSLKEEDDYMLVEMKQAIPSSLTPFVKIKQPQWETDAHRVVAIQQRMQNRPPALLSTTVFKDDAYLIQEMQPTKHNINFQLVKDQYRDMYQVIDDMAMLTASSQLRSSGRQGAAVADKLIAFGQDNTWQDEVLKYAEHYARKMKKMYGDYVKAFNAGKLGGLVNVE